MDAFGRPDVFPLKNVQNRLLFGCREPEEKEQPLQLFRFSDEDIRARRDLIERGMLFCGKPWYVLTRAFCEFLMEFLDRPAGRRLLEIFLVSFEPDETFLQTVINQSAWPSKLLVENENFRFKGGVKQRLLPADVTEMVSSGAMFARKVSPGLSNAILVTLKAAAKQ